MMVYAFERKADGSAVYVQAKSRYGNWSGVDSLLPRIHVNRLCSDRPADFSLTTGKDYQFALSARSNNGTGAPVMQKIEMGSGQQIRCIPR